jgi:hypothetical protein
MVLGFLHVVQGEFTDDVSETHVVSIFTGFRNVVGKFTPYTVQKLQNKKKQVTTLLYFSICFFQFL